MISLIVPIYNVERYLAECLDSIAQQTYRDFEVILVDDASTDDSMRIAEQYADKDDRFQIIHHAENRGLAAARNTGIANAHGEYIAFADSDDWITNDYLEKLFEMLTQHNADISVCGRYLAYEDDDKTRIVKDSKPLFSGHSLTRYGAIRAINSYRSFDMSMWGKLFRKQMFRGIHFPNGKRNEDFFVCHEIMWKAQAIFYEDIPLYYYRKHSGSITTSKTVSMDYVEASDRQLAFIEAHCPKLRWVGNSAGAMARMILVNSCAKNRIRIDDVCDKKKLRDFTRMALRDTVGNPDLPSSKKMQVVCLAVSPELYAKAYLLLTARRW